MADYRGASRRRLTQCQRDAFIVFVHGGRWIVAIELCLSADPWQGITASGRAERLR